MDYADIPIEVDQIKHHMKIRREAIHRMMGDLEMLSKLLEEKIGKVAFLQYTAEVNESGQGDIFGPRKENNEEDR